MTSSALKNNMDELEKTAKSAAEKITEHITPLAHDIAPPTKKITDAVANVAKEAIEIMSISLLETINEFNI